MTTKPKNIVTSTGICEFCKGEIDKKKMTQHLKFCKQRLDSIAAAEKKSPKTKTRLFHILAEGKYNPQYWLHFEIPDSEALWSLDGFLKDMWIDDLDHLSGFTIKGTDYSNDYPDDFFSFSETEEVSEEEEEEVSEEERETEIRKFIDESIAEYLKLGTSSVSASLATDPFPTEWIAEIKKPRSVDELIDYLKEELPRIEKEQRSVLSHAKETPPEELRMIYLRMQFQKTLVGTLLDAIEDRSMDALLGRVLKVGQKFSYVYDYGSSTYIDLKVIAERDGIVQDKKKPIQLLAQNTLSTLACTVCGKPATQVAMGYFYGGIEDSVYCDACAEKEIEEGQALPIINSPRVGVL